MSNNLEHLDVKYWVETIICHPELEDQCPWEKLRSSAWRNILMARPEFIRHAPQEIPLSFMSTKQWLEVLIAHPELDKYVPSAKVLVDKDSDILGGLWGTLLSRYPEFAKYEPWSHLRRDDWRKVLCQQPQFIDKYESVCSVNKSWLFTLSPMDQAIIIACQPALFKHFNTDVFGDGAWTTVLCSQPQFLEYCKLNKFSPLYLGQILKCYPEWLAYCETYSRSPEDILRIALNFPEVLNHYELDRFTEIGNGDTPWIEKFPCLVPYSQWNFSYPYWNSLMTHCSDWLETGRRPCVDVLAKKFDWISSNEKCHGRKDTQGDSLTENQPAKNLRNSLKTIMSFLKCGISDRSTQQANSIPLRIRNILENLDLTYEELMIKMSMMMMMSLILIYQVIFFLMENRI